jgi:hypothetical protein
MPILSGNFDLLGALKKKRVMIENKFIDANIKAFVKEGITC